MTTLLELSENVLAYIPSKFERFLFNTIRWYNRLIGIKGARGTGKTAKLPGTESRLFLAGRPLFYNLHTKRNHIGLS